MIEIKRKEGESTNSLLYRFSKIIRQSGVLKEAKKRMFYSKKPNKNARRKSAIYRSKKTAEIERLKKFLKS